MRWDTLYADTVPPPSPDLLHPPLPPPPHDACPTSLLLPRRCRVVDHVLTTRDLGRVLRESGIDFAALPDEQYDEFLGPASGAAALFGTTGGVMEAALRYCQGYGAWRSPAGLVGCGGGWPTGPAWHDLATGQKLRFHSKLPAPAPWLHDTARTHA